MPRKVKHSRLTLDQIEEKFSDEMTCKKYLAGLRWKEGPVCPHCDNKKSYLFSNGDYKCAGCRKKYSVRVGTIFEDSKLPLRKWFMAAYIITAHKKGISSCQLARDIDVTQKTAWFMLHRLKYALRVKSFEAPMEGVVEADETYVGGKEANKHKSKRQSNTQGRSTKVKTPVFGMLQRNGRVVAMTVQSTSAKTLQPIIKQHIAVGATLVTDEWKAYVQLHKDYQHNVVKHGQGQYVDGENHTNTIEGFWSLFKRGVAGIYHWVSVKHLDQYVGEFQYRYNTRKMFDGERFESALRNVEGRLKYKTLIEE